MTANRSDVVVKAGSESITPSTNETLLGGHLDQDLKWKDHILGNKKSLVKQLTTRLNGLSLVSKRASFKTRIMVANAVINSKLCFLIALWGSTQDYLLRALQVIQNKAARQATGLCWFTPTATLLRKCKWLSVKQLSVYHTILTTHKVVMTSKPTYLFNKMCTQHEQNTRQAVKFDEKFAGKTERAQSSFCYRGAVLYNKLPLDIRGTTSNSQFKKKLKEWVAINITID